jgi:hypothetical protein
MRLDLGRLGDPDQLHHADLVVIQDEPGHLSLACPDVQGEPGNDTPPRIAEMIKAAAFGRKVGE